MGSSPTTPIPPQNSTSSRRYFPLSCQVAEQYLHGEIEDIGEFKSLREVRELFTQFRQLYRKLEKKVQETVGSPKPPEPGAPLAQPGEAKKQPEEAKAKGVGDTEETAAGFGFGKALKDSKPKVPVDVAGKPKKPDEEEPAEDSKAEPEEGKEPPPEELPGTEMKTKKEKKVEVLDRQAVGAGCELA